MKKTLLNLIFILITCMAIHAQNPIIQTMYTADPAPMVYNDRLYLYTSHDEDGSTWFTMNDWRLYSTADMVNWTDHGSPISYKTFNWARGDAWAAQCIERNGKFYMYVPVTDLQNRPAIGVAVADSPYGPFYDPIGKPLAQTRHGDIDPTVFVDSDDQAYLYWGNPDCYYVKLNENMISYQGEIEKIPMTQESFGKRENDTRRATLYEEAPWLYKRNNLYYLIFAGGPIPEHIGYATSNSPTGPWKYNGVLMPTQGKSFTNHPGIVDFKGNHYFFYHNGDLEGGSGFTRSVCVEQFDFNNDGTIPLLTMTKDGITKGVDVLNPFVKTEAETIAWSEGIKSSTNEQVGVFVIANKNNSYIKVKDVDFRNNGTSRFTARVGTIHNGITMEVRTGTLDGKLLCTIEIPRTGGTDRWSLMTADVPSITGIQDLYFIFKGQGQNNMAFFDYWMFEEISKK